VWRSEHQIKKPLRHPRPRSNGATPYAVKQRLHQASFREAVITAYNGRCALSGLPEPLLLDAAHIVADRHEQLGQPVVPHGIPLSKIHHAAFDTHYEVFELPRTGRCR
jgi:predicted restriction endonuclease